MFVCTVRTRNRTQLLAPIRFWLGATAEHIYSCNYSNFIRYHMYRQIWTARHISVCSYHTVFIVNHMLLFNSLLIEAIKAQWSLYVPHSGHYMYRTVVAICTAQRSLYVPHSGHYMYRTAVNICAAPWSLYVPHSGHYMYRTVVTICAAQRSLYVQHSGHYMYRTAVTICTAQWSLYVPPGLPFNNSTFCPHSVFMCFVWIWEQTAIISLCNVNWLVCITETVCVCLLGGTGWVCR